MTSIFQSRNQETEKEVIHYNNVLKELYLSNSKVDKQLVLTIHKGITKGLLIAAHSGKYRKDAIVVNDPKARKIIYLPPDHDDIPRLMDELFEYIETHPNLDPVLLAGIVHKQLVIIHPFMDGNGRTARLITKQLLSLIGLDTLHLFSFENYYNQNVTHYFHTVGVQGNYYDIKDSIDFTPWLEYFSDGIIDELLRVQKILDKTLKTPDNKIFPYHQKILDYIQDHGYIADSDYAKLVDRAKATRSLDFKYLIKRGLIRRQGKGKNTHYIV